MPSASECRCLLPVRVLLPLRESVPRECVRHKERTDPSYEEHPVYLCLSPRSSTFPSGVVSSSAPCVARTENRHVPMTPPCKPSILCHTRTDLMSLIPTRLSPLQPIKLRQHISREINASSESEPTLALSSNPRRYYSDPSGRVWGEPESCP
jgi:hypothetical protein